LEEGVNLLTIGINHQIAPVDVREKVALAPDTMQEALADLKNYLNHTSEESSEVAILSTCNRMEVYCAANDQQISENQIQVKTLDWLASQKKLSVKDLMPYVQTTVASEAVRHVFRVGCGLDSMVLGETQILGQMKQAAADAQKAGSISTYLNQLFNKTFSVAKEVRATTEISTHAISLASAAVKLSSRVLGPIENQRVLFIGAGEMINLCATHFSAKLPKSITISNRTPQRAQALVETLNNQGHHGVFLPLADVPKRLHEFDIIVSCTSSTLPIIGLGMVTTALNLRKRQPMVLVDLAVPRDFEPEINHLQDIYLYTVDDLGEVVKEGMQFRSMAVKGAEEIIDTQVTHFMHWLQQRSNVPFINSLIEKSEALQQIEIEKAKRRLIRGEDPLKVMTELARGLANKFMHGSLHSLHQSDEQSMEEYQKMLTQIFMANQRKH
jgi:glutamyl-tRNA reductase